MLKKLAIIPAFNEEESLLGIIEELKESAPDFDYIIVNDGSDDNTDYICKKHKLNALNLPVNLGIGAAVQTGYIYAYKNDYDIAVQLDGDGQHDPSWLKKIIEPIELNKMDFVIGSRFLKNDEGFKSTKMRRLGITLLAFLIYVLTGKKLTDVTSGFRAANKEIISLFAKQYSKDYPEPESLVFLLKRGFRVSEEPVVMRERMNGKSSINLFKAAYYMFKVSISMVLASFEKPDALDEEPV